MGEDRSDVGGGTEQVLVEHVAQLGVRDFLRGADLPGAGIVDQYVDSPECIQCALHDLSGRGRFSYVVFDRQELVSVPSLERVEPLDAARGAHDSLPGLERGIRQCQSET